MTLNVQSWQSGRFAWPVLVSLLLTMSVANATTQEHWSAQFVQATSEMGIGSLHDDPGVQLSRGEFIRTLLLALGYEPLQTLEQPFPDLAAQDQAEGWAARAVQLGILRGYADGTCRLAQPVRRSESIAFLTRLPLGLPKSAGTAPHVGPLPHWLAEAYLEASSRLRGVAWLLDPATLSQPLTAGECACLIHYLLYNATDPDNLPEDGELIAVVRRHVYSYAAAFAGEGRDFGPFLETMCGLARSNAERNLAALGVGRQPDMVAVVNIEPYVVFKTAWLAIVASAETVDETWRGITQRRHGTGLYYLRRDRGTWRVFK